jgi:hypothetical protein
MAGEFAVHLGGGVYLDSVGTVTFQAPPDAQIYEAPAGFKIDHKKLQDTFKDLSGILPSTDEEKAKWIKWGAPADVVELLSKVSGVAGIIGTAVATYFWAVGVIVTLMNLITGDDQMSPTMAKAFDGLRNRAKGNEQKAEVDKSIDLIEPFKTKSASMAGIINALNTSGAVGPSSYPIYEEMRNKLSELESPVGQVCDEAWLSVFDSEDFKGRIFLSGLLVTVEEDGSLKPTSTTPSLLMFNYRMGVPALLYCFTTYMAMLRAGMPWFRTHGQFAPLLRRAAGAVDIFVMNMQRQCLGRTLHSAQTILKEQVFPTFQIPMAPRRQYLGPSAFYTYPAGAFDLTNYNDAYLGEQYTKQFMAKEDDGRRGAFDYTFQTPHEDLDEIAAAANDQAAQDYVELQAVSGLFHLLKLAGELRWLSTPPMQSEIVRGKIDSWRRKESSAPAQASSPPIFPVGVIKADATLNRYEAKASLVARTQEPGFFAPKFYRVMLRAVDSRTGKEGWRNQDYIKDVWRPFYRKADGDPKNLQLDSPIKIDTDAFLWQKELYSGHPSADTKRAGDRERFPVSTFDWYVPMLSFYGPFVDIETEAKHFTGKSTKPSSAQAMMASGGLSIHAWGTVASGAAQYGATGALPVLGGGGTIGGAPLATPAAVGLDDLDAVHILSDVSLERAERRHVRQETVDLEWDLEWTGGDLKVNLKGDPNQRPFQVFLVIEERSFSGSADTGDTIQLHMPFKAEIINQAMLVPESFFKEEAAALERGEKLYDELNTKYAEQGPVGPLDPIVKVLGKVQEELAVSQSTATIADSLQTRLDFMRNSLPEAFEVAAARMRRMSNTAG